MQLPIESLNLLMLNVGFAEHHADWNWKNVSSPFTRIYCVTLGEAWVHLPGHVVHLTPGHLYIIPPHTTHSYECSGDFSHYYLHVYEGFKKETDIFEFYDFPIEVACGPLDESLFRQLCEYYPQAALPASDPRSYDNSTKVSDYIRRYNDLPLSQKMQIRGATLLLFSHFLQDARPRIASTDDRMLKVQKYIHNNIYDDIDLHTLADVACVTHTYLIRLFNKNFGMSPLQYINQKKVERAQLLLLTSEMPVKEVAYSLGFTDSSYFIRLFKKTTQLTPQEYRERMS